ncbi:myoferlin-like [Penaeus japonicus]|uniref:myoferlin-like n=1 Tax=Penaeus japonicus TaxID=27405 RepID=UPI001C70C984|nr:myoferlin-like [Penaeus japonicus]
MSCQELDASEPEPVLEELQSALTLLEDLAVEPQNSIPDVFLWFMSGTRRLAYVRIPAHAILHSQDIAAQGELAGKFNTYTLCYLGPWRNLYYCAS